MRSILSLLVVLACMCPAEDGGTKPVAPTPAAQPANIPTDMPGVKLDKEGKPDKGFMALHESFLKRDKEGPIGVLFLGDSITQGWSGAGKAVWAERYAKLQAANFGIAGDRTQHVLWRIANGELDGIAPKVVVLMIGTNNSGAGPADISKGVRAIVAQIRAKLPASRLLLLGIFPRVADPKHQLRARLTTVNHDLATLEDGKLTRYLDIGSKFLDADGVLPKDIMPDALHPNAKGYQIWADAMQPLLDELLK